MSGPRLFDLRLPDLSLQGGGVVEEHHARGWWWGPETDLHALEERANVVAREGPAGAQAPRGVAVLGERRGRATFDPRIPTVLLVHALTGDARAGGEGGWWEPLIGPGKPLDPTRVRILCFNNLGSHYGSSGPVDRGWPEGAQISTGDQAKAVLLALDALGVERLHLAAGGSLGGMIVLALAALAPTRVARIMTIAAAASASAWLIGFNHVARQIIRLDPGFPHQVTRGLEVARQLAMLTYRAEAGLELSNGRDAPIRTAGRFAIEGYLEHQGVKLSRRFDARAYLCQLDAMDSHDIRAQISQIKATSLVVDIETDQLYSKAQARWLVEHLPGAKHFTVHSAHGHDAFLIEWSQLAPLVTHALELTPGEPSSFMVPPLRGQQGPENQDDERNKATQTKRSQ
jgi:homoserine O-acetyltransferase